MSSSSTNSSRIEIRRHSAEHPWTYELLDRYQRGIAEAVRLGRDGRAILSEVASVVTLGKRETADDLLVPTSELRERGIQIYRTDRGGRATYHGPGQWVAFAVESLEKLTGDPRGVRKAAEAWLRVALEVCRVYVPAAEVREGAEAGIWDRTGGEARKLAAMGLKVEKGVLLHGISINVFETAESFYGIRPCGLEARPGFLVGRRDERVFSEVGSALSQMILREFSVFGVRK